MSTETFATTPSPSSKPATSPMQSSMATEQARPHAGAQQAQSTVNAPLADDAPKAASHACCHTVGAVSPTTTIGSSHAGEARSGAPAASHSCASHKMGANLQSLVNEIESPDAARRAAAAIAMGRLADRAAVAPLIGALRDTDADVSREAAAALGALGDASAVEPLIAVLQNADGYFHPVVRAAATFSLGQLHDLRAFDALVQAISDPIAEASAEAIRSLATLADPRGVAPLLDVIRNQNGFFLETTRHAAILGLAKLGGPQAEFELRFVSTNSWEDAVIREAAVQAVGALSPAVAAK